MDPDSAFEQAAFDVRNPGAFGTRLRHIRPQATMPSVADQIRAKLNIKPKTAQEIQKAQAQSRQAQIGNIIARAENYMKTPEQLEEEINQRTDEKHAQQLKEWHEKRDEKYGLIKGTSQGFTDFADKAVTGLKQVADVASTFVPVAGDIYSAINSALGR